MNYYLHKFGLVYASATVLPVLGADQQIGPDPVLPTNVVLPGGVTFDTRGTDQALPSGHTVTARGFYRAADEAALQILVDAMQAWIGKRTKLWLYCADATQRWRYARLLSAPLTHLARGYGRFQQPMTLTFELDDMLWYGADATHTLTLNERPKIGVSINDGNQTVRDIRITVTAKESAITQLDIANDMTGHVSLVRFSGTIAQNTSLVIDCGEMKVENNEEDAWNDLNRISGHKINEWYRVGPGDNITTVTRTDGGNTSTCKLEFYDGYA